MYDVITVGSSTVDAFAKTNFSELIKIVRPDGKNSNLLAYPTGSKILINELKFTTGGGGTNTAVCLKRLGHNVAYLGKMGTDENGDFIINKLKKEKIDLLVVRKKGLSGYSMILDSLEHDRTILAYKGLNDKLRYSEVPLKRLNTKWFYFSSMLNESLKTLEKLSVYANKKGIRYAFNASSYLCRQGPEVMRNTLSYCDIFILNDDEARILVGSGSLEDISKRINNLGPKIVVITRGKNGSFVYDSKYFYEASISKKTKPIETTGAGDAFASSFLSGMIKKDDIEFSIKLATTNAESVISHHGAKNKLLRYKEALAIMKKNKIKIIKKKA